MREDAIISVSSCWNSARHIDGYEMIVELRELGFEYVELSHGIRMTLVSGILRAFEEGIIKISSTHNFCPLPSGVQHAAPNFYQPTAPGHGERTLWNTYSRKSLEFACQVGARHVVMHSGSAYFFWGKPHRKLNELEEQVLDEEGKDITHLKEDEAYQKELKRVLKTMAGKSKRLMPRLQKGMHDLLELAEEKDVYLCLENRESLLELPLDREFPDYLKGIGETDRVRYWHDFGHAQIKHLQGVIDHEELLSTNIDHLAGFHLHDVDLTGKDHMPLGMGTIDYSRLKRYLDPAKHRFILELSPRLTPEAIVASRRYLEDLLG